MKTKQTILILMMAVATFTSSAQTYYINKVWEKELGGYNQDFASEYNAVILDHDSNIIVTGSPESNINGSKTVPNCGNDTSLNKDYWLIKLNQSGNIISQQTYGGAGSEGAHITVLNNDGTLLIGGSSDSDSSCQKSQDAFNNGDMWIIKTDSAGQKIWDKQYGSSASESVVSILPTIDGGWLLQGTHSGSVTGGNLTTTAQGSMDLLLIKIDSLGNIEWDSLYGSNWYDVGRSIKDINNNFLLYGETSCAAPSGNVSDSGVAYPLSGSDNWLMKIDAYGNQIWDRRYGCYKDDHATTAMQNYNGEYVIAGTIDKDSCLTGNLTTDNIPYGILDVIVYGIDSGNGNMLYNKRIGGNNNEQFNQILQTSDRGYLFAGYSNSDVGFDKSEPRFVGPLCTLCNDVWIVRTDSAFNILWDKTIGGSGVESAVSVALVNDSTFLVACTTNSQADGNKGLPLYDTTNNPHDIWLSKWSVSTVNGINEVAQPQFTIYPNPVKDVLYVTTKKSIPVNSVISIMDMQGRMVGEKNTNHTYERNNSVIPINVSVLSQGVYLLKINGQVQRFVKM